MVSQYSNLNYQTVGILQAQKWKVEYLEVCPLKAEVSKIGHLKFDRSKLGHYLMMADH